jgi:hypothetical protein
MGDGLYRRNKLPPINQDGMANKYVHLAGNDLDLSEKVGGVSEKGKSSR